MCPCHSGSQPARDQLLFPDLLVLWPFGPSQEEILLKSVFQQCSLGADAAIWFTPGSLATPGDLPDCLLISPFLDSPFLSTHAAQVTRSVL